MNEIAELKEYAIEMIILSGEYTTRADKKENFKGILIVHFAAQRI